MSGIDSAWSMQAVTALDISAMAATENIVNSSQDSQPARPMERGGLSGPDAPPLLDTAELSSESTATGGPGRPLHVAGRPTDYDSALLIPVASTAQGGAQDRASDYLVQNQMDRAFSSNLAARTYVESQVGAIVDYRA